MIISAFIGCENVNELHEQYLREGSPIYAGKIDSLDTYSGLYRIKASVYPSLDVNRDEFRVYWNNFSDSLTFKYDDSYLNTENGRYEVIIDGFEQKMTEGYTTLTFKNFDSQSHQSRETESTVLIYGNDFTSGLLNQRLSGFDGQFLNFVYRDGAVGLMIQYTTNENEERTLEFDGAAEKLKIIGLNTDLPDFKSGSKLSYKTLYHLNPTDIDSIYSSNFSESSPIILPDPVIIEDSVVHKYGFSEDFNLSVEVYEGESFTSVSDQPWCTVSDANVSGNIQVSIEGNATGSRTATITVSVDGKTGADFTKEIQIVQSDAVRLNNTKSGWAQTTLSDDNQTGWGWDIPNLWNGDNGGTGYHTNASLATPYLLSFNFGVPLQIDGVEIAPRAVDNINDRRNPELYEVWASNTVNEVGVDRYSDEWETKAVEAGWVKLKYVDLTGWTGKDIRIGYVGATEKYQYMRIRVLKNSAGEPNYFNIMELSIIGKE